MKNVPALHGLRGLAVVIVLLSHWGNAGHHLLPVPHDGIGKVGVWMFFALSAYLLTTGLSRVRNLPAYAVNRVARIMPLYLLFIGMHVAIGDIPAGDAWRHVLMVEAWQEAWAIPVEVTYYLLLPLIALPPRLIGSVLAGVALVIALASPPAEVFSNGLSIVSRLAPFALGSLAALWRPRINGWWQASAAVGLALGVVCYRENLGDPRGLSVLLGLSSVGLILACAQTGVLSRFFASSVLVWFGKVSFSLYLLHMLALRFAPNPWLALALTLLASAITYRWLEVPAMRFGRGISSPHPHTDDPGRPSRRAPILGHEASKP